MVAKYLVSNAAGNPINISVHVCPDQAMAKVVADDLEQSYGPTQTLEFETDSDILNLSLDFGGNLIGAVEPFEFVWQPNGQAHKVRFFMHLQHFWEGLTEFRAKLSTDKEFVRLHGAFEILCLATKDAQRILQSLEENFDVLKERAEQALSSFRYAIETTEHPSLGKVSIPEPSSSDN